MARNVLGGLIQCSNPINDPNASVAQIRDAMFDKHLPFIDDAGKKGVQILCLQEVFNSPYFCPSMDPKWRKVLLVCRASRDAGADSVVPDVSITREDQVPMREDLLELVDIEELEKYFTPEELVDHPARRS